MRCSEVAVRAGRYQKMTDIVTKLETSSRQNRTKIESEVGTGSDGNLMPLDNFKTLFPKATIQQLAKTQR